MTVGSHWFRPKKNFFFAWRFFLLLGAEICVKIETLKKTSKMTIFEGQIWVQCERQGKNILLSVYTPIRCITKKNFCVCITSDTSSRPPALQKFLQKCLFWVIFSSFCPRCGDNFFRNFWWFLFDSYTVLVMKSLGRVVFFSSFLDKFFSFWLYTVFHLRDTTTKKFFFSDPIRFFEKRFVEFLGIFLFEIAKILTEKFQKMWQKKLEKKSKNWSFLG